MIAVFDSNLLVSAFILKRGGRTTTRSRRVAPAKTEIPAVRDPDDELLLRVTVAGNADYLVTGDKDLLVLRGTDALGSLQIVTPRDFLKVLTASRTDETSR